MNRPLGPCASTSPFFLVFRRKHEDEPPYRPPERGYEWFRHRKPTIDG